MNHFTSPPFWECYQKGIKYRAVAVEVEELPRLEPIQKLADENFELLKRDPRHPSLHLKRVEGYWSVRAGINYIGLNIASNIGLSL